MLFIINMRKFGFSYSTNLIYNFLYYLVFVSDYLIFALHCLVITLIFKLTSISYTWVIIY